MDTEIQTGVEVVEMFFTNDEIKNMTIDQRLKMIEISVNIRRNTIMEIQAGMI